MVLTKKQFPAFLFVIIINLTDNSEFKIILNLAVSHLYYLKEGDL